MAKILRGAGLPNRDGDFEEDRGRASARAETGPELDDESAEGEEGEDADEDDEAMDRLHERIRLQFGRAEGIAREERMQNLKDRRFVDIAGGQWEGYTKQFENRPRMEINKTSTAVDQIEDDFRKANIGVKFRSKDHALDPQLADDCAAMYRADEQDSNAAEAYANCAHEMSSGGIGGWRLKTRFEDPESDEEDDPQRIGVEPIYEADRCVFFDPDARLADKSDAQYAYLLVRMSREAYERRYPDDDVSSWPEEVHQGEFDWFRDNTIYLVEYFEVERVPDVRCYYKSPVGEEGDEIYHLKSELKDDPELAGELEATGWTKTREQKVKRKRIHKYLANGMRIMKDYGRIAGCYIPLVLAYGRRTVIDDVERTSGHVRRVADAQRIKNMLISKMAEWHGEAAMPLPIMTKEQMTNNREIWARKNIDKPSWLPINPIMNGEGQLAPLPPVGYTQEGQIPAVTGALHQTIDADMKELLSSPDPGGKVLSHVSTSAVQAANDFVDKKSSLYIDNMAKAEAHSGRIWLGMAPEVYHQRGRKLRGLDARGKATVIAIGKPMLGPDKQIKRSVDLSRARLDVVAEAGPSSRSKREARIKAGLEMLQYTKDPETQSIVQYWIMLNSEEEGSSELEQYFRKKLVEMKVIPPTPEEEEAMAEAAKNAQPSPIDQLALAQAEESKADAGKAEAERQLALARAEKTKAETAKIMAEAEKVRTDTAKVHADANLDASAAALEMDRHKLDADKAKVDAAKTLHDMELSVRPEPGQGKPGGQP